jgi:hypothetical protein
MVRLRFGRRIKSWCRQKMGWAICGLLSKPNDRFGSVASVWRLPTNSALPRRTDIIALRRHVPKVPNPDSCGAAKHLIRHLVGAGKQRPIDVGSTAASRHGNSLRCSAWGQKRIRKGEPQGGVHRLRERNSSSNCDSFGTVSKCGASDGIVSQDALDPVNRCAPVSRVSASSSKPAGTQ